MIEHDDVEGVTLRWVFTDQGGHRRIGNIDAQNTDVIRDECGCTFDRDLDSTGCSKRTETLWFRCIRNIDDLEAV